MFKNMKLGVKIAAGFAAILILSTVLGGFCTISMKNAQIQSGKLNREYVPMVTQANNVERSALKTIMNIKNYAISEDDSYLTESTASFEELKKCFKEAEDFVNKSASLNTKEMAEHVNIVKENLSEYEKAVSEIKVLIDDKKQKYAEACKTGIDIVNDLRMLYESGSPSVKAPVHEAMELLYENRLAAMKTIFTKDPAPFKAKMENFDKINGYLSGIKDAASLQQVKKITENCEKYKVEMVAYCDQMIKLKESFKKLCEKTANIQADACNVAEGSIKNAQDIASISAISLSVTSTLMIIGSIVAIALGSILAWLIV
ncbi:MAG: MCP four helix bundle domain-containing protein, partial [Candidatus Gastranaerophilales bacterium]|nr:MCP four helix bundle domain-containing protein [Candidatus Gastranaerophilales bacterium]